MTPEQFALLMKAMEHGVAIVGWVLGVSITVILALLTIFVSILHKVWSKKIEDVSDTAKSAAEMVKSLSKAISEQSLICKETRAACREDLLSRVQGCPSKELVSGMDRNHRELIEKAVNGVSARVLENRDFVAKKIDELQRSLEAFKRDVFSALHSHRHSNDGSVIRGDR